MECRDPLLLPDGERNVTATCVGIIHVLAVLLVMCGLSNDAFGPSNCVPQQLADFNE